ncbi:MULTISPECIES: LysR substrate-binding domain-containing protein [Pseudomonas]|uniref:LysR family transcriptional regulator n=2 Tax=Pseudomonas putida group TaxID=136845 RepID=A0AAE6V252_9PSED|nr:MULTISPECIES: LysR substrate-binding domain-containing protein [Pseudomonas]MCJ7852936.1 LysR substrate-binding domain-containing protein [Pseudomonas monteilii]MDD2124325.1 LysR substrate-binding domain-containing protein [Pseudomonas monteilii]MDI3369217.1 LysR substrate-binding domain-containing protein [Pseudomonas sp. V104_10]NBB03741.1 LysR family transcriptional regulator [Pseudomonas monteilii]QHB28009.1 LysR family transcriptional regulator [Pseudomonas monteilii]
MIETRLLRQFIAVAEELHFHKAAERLHMAQPPLSQAISRLEEKLGFSLFLRNTRGVRLTPAGTAFRDTAYRVLAELEQGIEYARNVSAGVSGKLTITAISIAYYDSLLTSLRRYRETYPNVQLTLREMPSATQAKALLAGEADIGFMRRLPLPVGTLESRLLLDEQIVMALPAGHVKAQQGDVDLREFANEDFVFTPQALGGGYHAQLVALCESAGFYPRVVQEAAQIHTLLGLVACGFGVALVPASFARSTPRERVQFCAIRPIDEQATPGIGLYMKWNAQNASPALANFIALFEDAKTL